VSPLGAGGMGEVFRATDSKLDREVAIKVLPDGLAQDPERLARFEREARLLASLNHPNVAHVYGFESATLADGSAAHFLAMELVEGEDLAERLKRGAIPVDEAIGIAEQIAEALEEAHEHGIVHRDLKPANVKVTPDGKVKVLDFGLAKAWQGPGAASADLSQSPTLAHTGTAAGLIHGTAAYMSPEQARGRPVDRKSDIWAFGALLYEMLTGKPLFTGDTIGDVLASVLRQEVDWTALLRADGSELRRLTSDSFKDRGPAWDPAGERLAFFSTRGGRWDFWSIRVDGSDLRQLTALGEVNYGSGWSPDGRRLVLSTGTAEATVWLVDTSRVETVETARRLPPVAAEAGLFNPSAWSGQGDLVAGTVGDRAGQLLALGVLDLPSGAFRPLDVPTDGLAWCAVAGWLPDGRRLVARTTRGVAVIDTASGQWRVVAPAGPRDYLSLSRDGRVLNVEREVLDSDTWLMELR
jgi:hypothetical protein